MCVCGIIFIRHGQSNDWKAKFLRNKYTKEHEGPTQVGQQSAKVTSAWQIYVSFYLLLYIVYNSTTIDGIYQIIMIMKI